MRLEDTCLPQTPETVNVTTHGKDFAGAIKKKLLWLFWILQGNLNVTTNALEIRRFMEKLHSQQEAVLRLVANQRTENKCVLCAWPYVDSYITPIPQTQGVSQKRW